MKMTTKKLSGMVLLMAAAFAAQAGIIADRYPNAFVKTTPKGEILAIESEWHGHVKRTTELKEISGQTWFLVEPTVKLPPSPTPSQNNFVTSIIVNGELIKGVWLQGRSVVIP